MTGDQIKRVTVEEARRILLRLPHRMAARAAAGAALSAVPIIGGGFIAAGAVRAAVGFAEAEQRLRGACALTADDFETRRARAWTRAQVSRRSYLEALQDEIDDVWAGKRAGNDAAAGRGPHITDEHPLAT